MRLLVLFLSAAVAMAGSLDVVKTESSLVSGTGTDVRVFKGIPYAAANVAALRFRPPQSPPHWEGVRQATDFGAPCPQPTFIWKLPPQSEDCLTLNIWAPVGKSENLPVMVSIHGGGFVAGWSGLPASDGDAFAREGVVFVSLNYRLGAFGFLAHPALSSESPQHSSGNYGLLDQVAALRWIRNNIAAFGGDPSNVTIFGESAGGTSVSLLLICPLAKNLFQRVISESAAWLYLPISHRSESWYGREPAERLGESIAPDAGTLRAMSMTDLVKKTPWPDMTQPQSREFLPIVDGWAIPDDPAVLFESGRILCDADRIDRVTLSSPAERKAMHCLTSAVVPDFERG